MAHAWWGRALSEPALPGRTLTTTSTAVAAIARAAGGPLPVVAGGALPVGAAAPAAVPAAAVHCSLLATSFGWWLQVFLFVVCFVSLVGKRFTDRVRRPWVVWFMDTSKQALSAFGIHFLNILLSMAFGRWLDADVDPCNWYWVNLMLDDTLGVAVQFLLLKILKSIYRSRCVGRPELADTGEYGDPLDWGIWFRQLLDWQAVVMLQKCLLLVLVFKATGEVGAVANACLGWLDAYPRAKLVVVMVFTPLTMNLFALWVADNFLQGDQRMTRSLSRQMLNVDGGCANVVGHTSGGDDGCDDDEGDGVVGFQEWKRRVTARRQHRHLPTEAELSNRRGGGYA